MGRVWQLQSTFNRGELDPKLVGRKDIQSYYAGCRQARNVTPLVQGGVRRRNGTEYLHQSTNGRLFNFSFSTEVNYCLLITPGKIEIFKDGVLQTNINGSGDDFLANTFTATQIAEMDFIQSADVAILVHQNFRPKELSRTSDTAWTLANISFDNIPQFDFDDGDSPAPTSAVQTLTFVNAVAGDRFKIALEGILTDDITFAAPSSAQSQAANAAAIQDALTALPNTAGEGTVTVTAVSNTEYDVTFSAGSARPLDLMSVTPIYVQNASGFRVDVAEDTAGVARTEDVWSATRGWPRTCVFHEGRLWFGGSRSRPQTLWGSKVNYFYDFNLGKSRDDEAIEVTLDTDQVNAIQAIFSNRNLQIFTTGAEFYVPQSPITPAEIAVLPQTNFGAKRIRPITIDGRTLYVQRTGKSLRDFLFVDSSRAYDSSPVSIQASHLINDPVDMAASRGTSSIDANYAYIVNADGSMAVYNSLQVEEVFGFTLWETDGEIVSATVVDDTLYTYVRRNIGGSDVYYLERENPSLTTDSSVSAVSTDTLTGLSHLEGETIQVVADGSYMGEFVVSGGEVTINRTADSMYGGLPYTPIVQTMPLNFDLSNGSNAARKKRIVRCGVELFESLGVLVNGVRIADKTLGVNTFDPPSPQTALKTKILQGWSTEAQVTITQDEPMPMTILALYIEVSV